MPNRRKSQQAEREYEKIKSQLEGLEESVRDRCKKEFTGRGCPWQVDPQASLLSIPGSFKALLKSHKLQEDLSKGSKSRWPGNAPP